MLWMSNDHQLEEPSNGSSHQQWKLMQVGAPQVNQLLLAPLDSSSCSSISSAFNHQLQLGSANLVKSNTTLQYSELAHVLPHGSLAPRLELAHHWCKRIYAEPPIGSYLA